MLAPASSLSSAGSWASGGAGFLLAHKRAGWLARRAFASVSESRTPHGRLATPASRARALQRLAIDVCREHEIVPLPSGDLPRTPTVIVCNHQSYIDPILIASLVQCAPIAKSEISRWPLVGAAIRHLGILFVRRGDPHSGAATLRGALRALDIGVSVLNFPEGTTTDGRSVLPFRHGIFGLARIAGVSVTPVAIQLDSRELCWVGGELFLPHYLGLAGRRTTRVRVEVGEPLDSRSFAHAGALADEARARVQALALRASLSGRCSA